MSVYIIDASTRTVRFFDGMRSHSPRGGPQNDEHILHDFVFCCASTMGRLGGSSLSLRCG